MVLVKDRYVVDELKGPEFGKEEQVWARVQLAKGAPPLILCAYYRPQTDDTPNTSLGELNKSVQHVSSKYPSAKIVIGGDFNCDKVDWEEMTAIDGNTRPRTTQSLIDLLTENELHQMQHQPTRQGALLDLLITNYPGLFSHSRNLPGISTAGDHDALVFDMEVRAHITKKPPRRLLSGPKLTGKISNARRLFLLSNLPLKKTRYLNFIVT